MERSRDPPEDVAACGAVNAVPLVLGPSKEAAGNLMVAFRAAADRSSELRAVDHAARGGVIMTSQVAKAFSYSGLTRRQTVSWFKYDDAHICDLLDPHPNGLV